MHLLAVSLWHHDPATGRLVVHALPVMVGVLCCLAIAYRYYSAFLAAKVAALDATRPTPAVRLNDGQNYHPTNKWVLFGHHFAAISGAGPLIGPVLAIQYGYLPGLLWLVVGVCLAGAVQDMLVLAASVRRDGKSLAEIARRELGGPAAAIASAAILFIVVIALAGLGLVVVKALGGEEAKLPAGMVIESPEPVVGQGGIYDFPEKCTVSYTLGGDASLRTEAFRVRCPSEPTVRSDSAAPIVYTLPAGCTQVIAGSSWGTFAIACTIPIALLVGLWMYRIRPGRIVEASIIGGVLTLAAVVLGSEIPKSPLEAYFSLTRDQTILSLCVYGFIAAVLPVWLLLGPRDYLSSFLKIGTVGLLVVSVCVANPPLHAPPLNEVFRNGGPTFLGRPDVPAPIFPFVFICVMCGSISGFHSLVASGTTPKMIESEAHVRTIGYGAMLIEGLVGVTALVAASALPPDLYFAINVPIDKAGDFAPQLKQVGELYPAAQDPLHAVAGGPEHLKLGEVERQVGGESLRGRTGGAVTLAVGMSAVFTEAFRWLGVGGEGLLKYWYHFAIMFEALFILTTIDAGTRIARFLVQETAGRVYAPLGRPDWLPGAVVASAAVSAGWGWLVWTGSVETIWPMFGVANQVLAVLALALVTTWLVNAGRGRYAAVTVVPMLFVMTTTLTAAGRLVAGPFAGMIDRGRGLIEKGDTAAGQKLVLTGWLNAGLTAFVVACVCVLVLWAAARWAAVWRTGGVRSRD